MPNRISVAVVKKDGSIVENNVYFNGNIEYTIKILQENYSDYKSAYKLCNYSFFIPSKKLSNFKYLKCKKILNIDDRRLYFKSIEDYNRFHERWTLRLDLYMIYMDGKWQNYKVYRTEHE